ncbi:MAG: HTTM domain-containing protein [Pirellulaceae bacterium]|nr:HTTM domain-containing protein [Pirellulaceae bacterium]
MRARSLTAMYTDAGFFPLKVWHEYVGRISGTTEPLGWSIHALHGGVAFQSLLFVVAALAALMMMLGWKTKIACVVSWVLLVSLQMRNPLILHSGDVLFRLALFWSMFLPLNAVWSLDAKKRGAVISLKPVFSGATVGLILTLFSLYFFAGIAKLNDFWFSGNAMGYVMKLDIYTTGFGKWLLQWPLILKILTWVTLAGELVLPVLLLTPWKNALWRRVALLFFVGLHLGIASCMSIGLFSPIAIAFWLALLPGAFWVRWTSLFFTRDASEPTPQKDSALPIWANVFCVFMVGYFLAWNIATINHPLCKKFMPLEARVVGKWLNMRQSFRMFDVPPPHSPWFVYEAQLKNGATVDIFRNKPVDHERPRSILATIPQHHWRRLHRNLARPSFEKYRVPVAEYMVRQWNTTHDEDSQILTAKVTAYLDEITRDSESNGLITQVWYQYGGEIADQQMFDELLEQVKEKGIILP